MINNHEQQSMTRKITFMIIDYVRVSQESLQALSQLRVGQKVTFEGGGGPGVGDHYENQPQERYCVG